MAETPVDLGFGGESLPVGSHVCWYYSGEGQLRETLQFIRLGLQREDEFCVLFADESRLAGLLGWLAEDLGENPARLVEGGRLALIDGAPTLAGLLEKIGGRLDRAVAEGYRVIRFLGFIAWGSPGWPDEETLLEFESRVNNVVTAYPAVIVCTYGVPTLAGRGLIYGGLLTHPISIIGGRVIRDSPFYVSPAAAGARATMKTRRKANSVRPSGRRG